MIASRQERGFTLVEMLFAIGVLVFGITSLIGVMSVGVSTRRTAEQRVRSSVVVEQVLHRIETEILAQLDSVAEAESAEDLDIPPLEGQLADDYAGIKYTVRYRTDIDFPYLVLATIHVSWLSQGESVAQTFHRILPRQKPFSHRVQRHSR